MTVGLPPPDKGWVKSVVIQDVRLDQSVAMGMGELFKWAQEDDSHPIPKGAIDYWNEARSGSLGPIHLMEVQTKLQEWGITFGRQEIKHEPEPVRIPNERQRQAMQRNGNGNGRHAEPPKFDLKSVLQERLAYLQGRLKEITGEVKMLQSEREEANGEIQQIVTFLSIQAPSRKRGKAVAADQLS